MEEELEPEGSDRVPYQLIVNPFSRPSTLFLMCYISLAMVFSNYWHRESPSNSHSSPELHDAHSELPTGVAVNLTVFEEHVAWKYVFGALPLD